MMQKKRKIKKDISSITVPKGLGLIVRTAGSGARKTILQMMQDVI